MKNFICIFDDGSEKEIECVDRTQARRICVQLFGRIPIEIQELIEI